MQAKGPAVVRMEPPIEPSLEKKKLGDGGGRPEAAVLIFSKDTLVFRAHTDLSKTG